MKLKSILLEVNVKSRYQRWKESGGKIVIYGVDIPDDKTVPPGKYTVVYPDEDGSNHPLYSIVVKSPIAAYDLAIKIHDETGFADPWGYLHLEKGHRDAGWIAKRIAYAKNELQAALDLKKIRNM